MRKNIDSMLGFSIMAIDGELGKIKDFYFDDETWTIRYLVVQTGSWLLGRKVLISFASVKKIDCESSTFSVGLSCEQVRNSPVVDTNPPVYRQHEQELHKYYMLPPYWGNFSGIACGVDGYSGSEFIEFEEEQEDKKEGEESEETEKSDENKHLRSARQITGYLIHAVDGEIGHVKDFIVDLKKGRITFLLVDTRNLLAGRKILLPTKEIERIEWAETEVYVNVSRGAIINSPEFDLDKDL